MKYILIIFLIVSCNAFEVLTGVKSKVSDGFDNGIRDDLEKDIEMFFEFNEAQSLQKISNYGGHSIIDNTFSPGVPNISSLFGSGLDCDSASVGTTNVMSLATNFFVGPDEDINISFYIKQSTFNLPQANIINFNNGRIRLGDADGAINNIHDIVIDLDNSIPVSRSLVDVVDLTGNQWKHLSINIFGNNRLEVFENGNFRGETNFSGVASGISTSGFSLCSDFTGVDKFNGQIDSLGIWRRALSKQEIEFLSDKGI